MSTEISDTQWLQSMRAAYLSTSGDKLVQLDDALRGLEQNPGSGTAFRKLDRLLHNLIGSGGSYGVPEVSIAARHMLDRLKAAGKSASGVDEDLLAALRVGMDELRLVFEVAGSREGPV